MTSSILRAAICSVILGAICFGQSGHPALDSPQTIRPLPDVQATFSLSVKAIPSVVRKGSPVQVEIVTTNTANQEIAVPRWFSDLNIIVLDNAGRRPLTSKGEDRLAGRGMIVGSDRFFLLGEGQSDKVTLTVNSELYDLSKPGTYTIQVKSHDDYTKTMVKSNVVTVTVQR